MFHETTLPTRIHQVRCQSSASKVAGLAMAVADLHNAAPRSRLHVCVAFEAIADIAQLNAEHLIRSHARQAVDRSLNTVNNKIQQKSYTSTTKS